MSCIKDKIMTLLNYSKPTDANNVYGVWKKPRKLKKKQSKDKIINAIKFKIIRDTKNNN